MFSFVQMNRYRQHLQQYHLIASHLKNYVRFFLSISYSLEKYVETGKLQNIKSEIFLDKVHSDKKKMSYSI